MKFFLISILLVVFFNGCSVKYDHLKIDKSTNQKIKQLSLQIQSLSRTINQSEAEKLAKEVVIYSKKLASDYDLVSPPLYHNYLVNKGIKKRGLCYHFANDMKNHIDHQNYKTIIVHNIISNKNEYFEHTALSVTSIGMDFKDGIILDAWRDSGELFFSKLKDDTRYNWVLLK